MKSDQMRSVGNLVMGSVTIAHLLAIDEIESSLHPMLALEIVRLFDDPEQNPKGAQLIYPRTRRS